MLKEISALMCILKNSNVNALYCHRLCSPLLESEATA